jgi:hypothetical protein
MSSRPSPWLYAVFALALFVIAPAHTAAQSTEPDPWESARWRFGPLAVTPKAELKNLGWDNNVFNETEDPKSDFTATAGAPIDWWLRFGRARLHGTDYFEGVYYATYSSQSSFNQRHDLTLAIPLNRIRPYVGGYYLSTNDRPGYEIDIRLPRSESEFNAGAIIRLTGRIDLDVSGRQITYTYHDQEYAGTPYSTRLNRRTEKYGAQARYTLTPLTTLTLLADNVRERFSEYPLRDNDGFRILPGVEFGQYALIQGKAQVGYRKFDTVAPTMPDFSGLVANAELSYAFRGMTRFTVGVSRDIYFSFEVLEPFYIQPGFTLSVTQQVTGPWDVQARGGWYRLNYQKAQPLEGVTAAGRVDRYNTFGGGIGYRVGRDIRVGFNVDYFRRESVLYTRDFEGLRAGAAVTYALK